MQQRDQSLATIVSGRPLFYLICLGLLGLGLRYRDPAQRWLDQRFFRAEYDAREILVSLAGRVPYEADPRDLVAMVVTQIDSALHPEGVAVLARATEPSLRSGPAGDPDAAFVPIAALRVDRGATARQQRHHHAAPLVGQAARSVPGRRAIAGGARAAGRSDVAGRSEGRACWCRSSRAAAIRGRWSA